jgi:hypothetical protein
LHCIIVAGCIVVVSDMTRFFDNIAFATGTAAELAPIARLATGEGEESFDVTFPHGTNLPGGPITTAILKLLRQVMVGDKKSAGTEGWLRDPFAPPEEFCKE